jgi:P pilus assembly chaperone PapD
MFFSKRLSYIAVGICLSAITLFSEKASAQINVSPLVIEAQPQGEQTETFITLTNTTSTPSRVRIYAEPFTYESDTGFQPLPSSPGNQKPNLQFFPRELTLKSGGSRQVRVISRFPSNLPAGKYRVVIFHETLSGVQDFDGNRLSLVAPIGVTLYFNQGNTLSNSTVQNSASKQK